MPNAYFVRVEGDTVSFDESEINHLLVTRARKGEEYLGVAGNGYIYRFILERIDKREAKGRILRRKFVNRNTKKLIVAVAVTKWPRLRIILEKATELGVDRIELFQSERSVVKLAGEKHAKYTAVIREAAKQSVAPYLPEVVVLDRLQLSGVLNLLLDFEGKAIRELSKELERREEIRLIVGPEGGFAPGEIEELALSSVKVSLGDRTLRVETAVIVALALINDYTGRS